MPPQERPNDYSPSYPPQPVQQPNNFNGSSPPQQQFGVPPQPTTVAPKKKSHAWLVLLFVWLCAIPVSLVVSFLSGFVFSDANNALTKMADIVSVLLNIYGILGWIPVVIVAVRK